MAVLQCRLQLGAAVTSATLNPATPCATQASVPHDNSRYQAIFHAANDESVPRHWQFAASCAMLLHDRAQPKSQGPGELTAWGIGAAATMLAGKRTHKHANGRWLGTLRDAPRGC